MKTDGPLSQSKTNKTVVEALIGNITLCTEFMFCHRILIYVEVHERSNKKKEKSAPRFYLPNP